MEEWRLQVDRMVAQSGKSEDELAAEGRRFGELTIAAPRAALDWLQRSQRVASEYVVARLACPRGKLLARIYLLPKDCEPVVNASTSGPFRLLVVPTNRGKVAALVGDPKISRDHGEAWWWMSLDDLWDLRCKCCPRPDGGVRARDFLDDEPRRGYRAVLI